MKLLAFASIGLICLSLEGDSLWNRSTNESGNHIIVVYDNISLKKGLAPSWGFACLVTITQYCILFDVGGDASILLKNMNRMDINPRIVDSVVLSHRHGDHTGGLAGFLQYHHGVTVYTPKSFSKRFKEDVDLIGSRVRNVGGPMMIHPGIHTTGELGESIKEQSLVLRTHKGLVIITGCAHPGIVEIVEEAVRLFTDKVYLLIGGFHLVGQSPKKIMNIIEKLDELKVERISPCHCSGDTAKKLLRRHYEENYIACGVGLVLEIPEIKR